MIYSNKDGVYNDSMTCNWTLSSNTNLELIFFRFDTELNYDYVYVYDGGSSSSTQLGKYHGNSLPPKLTSSSNQLFVTFRSDWSIVKAGFAAGYHGKRLLSLSVLMSASLTDAWTTKFCTVNFIPQKKKFTHRSS